jgi:thiamine-monophosphate kinase
MSGPDPLAHPDEFETIARLLRPLTHGHPAALDLLDDAAVLPARPGYDLVISKDAMVAGVHFLDNEPLDIVARRLLRTNLSDLAAKAAEPFGYFLAIAWPHDCGWPEREAFAAGLAEDGRTYGLSLLGGDTVSTPGPLTVSATILGWVPAGRMVRRGGARPGDRLLVSGVIGDGFLGLKAARGELNDPGGYLAGRYRLPEPRLALRDALLAHATASADVSDGLLADAGHIAIASGCGVSVTPGALPLSAPALAWVAAQPNRMAALLALAAGGDDYEVVCAVGVEEVAPLTAMAAAEGIMLTDLGVFTKEGGLRGLFEGQTFELGKTGFVHR